MAGSYSTDLRERVLAAVGAGATPEAAARRVAVGGSTAYRCPPGGAARGEADGRRAEAEDHGRGGGGVAGPAAGGEPPGLGRVPRPAGRADRGAGAPVDGGPGAAAVRLDVKEAEPARGRAGPRGRGRRAG